MVHVDVWRLFDHVEGTAFLGIEHQPRPVSKLVAHVKEALDLRSVRGYHTDVISVGQGVYCIPCQWVSCCVGGEVFKQSLQCDVKEEGAEWAPLLDPAVLLNGWRV